MLSFVNKVKKNTLFKGVYINLREREKYKSIILTVY